MSDPTVSRYVLTFAEDGERRSIPVDAPTAEAFIAGAEGRLPLTGRDRMDLADLAEGELDVAAFGVTRVQPPNDERPPWESFGDELGMLR
jgi:hypothetical protein